MCHNYNFLSFQLSSVEAEKLQLSNMNTELQQKVSGLESELDDKQETLEQLQIDKVDRIPCS